tara:strand:- start:1478 stop:3691 length:2214 start_codon:yes stop_codon:yes gene_type:complete
VASYDAIINLRLKGLDQLKEVDRAINGITGRTRTGRARTGVASVVKKELSAEQERLKTLGQIIKLKRIELGLNRQAGRTAQLIDKSRTDPRLLPSTKMLGQRMAKTGQVGGISRIQTSSQVTARFEERISQARDRSNQRNQQLLGSEKLRNAQLIKTNTFVKKSSENLIRLSDNFGKLNVSVNKYQESLVPKTRTSSGKMLSLPSSEMLDQRVRGSGQFGGFSRGLKGKSFRQRIGATRGFDRQSALISGAFPLLFGQGPIGAAAGALGGGVGGMFGQMGGFAGGIAATAVVQQIQQAITAVGDLGKAMSPFTQNTQALANALGLVGTPAGKYLETLEQTQGKQVAFNEAMRRMENLVGVNGVKALQDFGEGTRKLQQDITTFLTRIAAKAAELLNNIGGGGGGGTGRPVGLARANLLAQGKNTTTGPLSDEIQTVVAKLETATRKTRKGLQDELIELVKKRNLLQENLDITNNENEKFKEATSSLSEQNKFLQDTLSKGKLGAEIEKEKLAVAERLKKTVKDLTADQITQIENDVKTNRNLKEQLQIQEQIKNILSTSMTDAVMGLIDGTKSLSQSLAGVAKQLASMFLNRAFSAMFGGLFSEQGSYSRAGGFKAFQYGGVVNGPTLGMVGEGGEPEYIIPASKMDGAMQRYSSGARGGAVIPGGSHAAGTVAGASGNTVVEYTGPTLNFNGDNYVPRDAIPKIISTAAQQGASMGQSKMMNTLKNSRSQRSKLGI